MFMVFTGFSELVEQSYASTKPKPKPQFRADESSVALLSHSLFGKIFTDGRGSDRLVYDYVCTVVFKSLMAMFVRVVYLKSIS